MILITTDLHLTDNAKDAYRHDFMEWFIKEASKNPGCVVLILGDLTQEKDRHSAWLVNTIVDYIARLAKCTGGVIILKGNHDYINPENPFFYFLGKLEKVIWVNKPWVTPLDSLDCLFLPHTRDYKRDWSELLDKDYDLILAHQTFSGADVGNGKRLSGIPQNIFRKSANILSGDVHIPQELELVTYVGSPFRINYGDNFIPRILKIENDSFQYIQTPGPYKHLLEIKSLADLKSNKQLREGDMLKIKVDLTPTEYDQWQETKTSIRNWCDAQGYRLELIQPSIRIRRANKISGRVKNKSDTDLIKDYVKRRSVSDQFLKSGLDLLEG